jgi:hypothetical protein
MSELTPSFESAIRDGTPRDPLPGSQGIAVSENMRILLIRRNKNNARGFK